jgi:hydrogenase maturation protease
LTDGALVVGYGNVLRSDDGVGWRIGDILTDDVRVAGATILRCHQLTPELALDVSRASVVVLVDAQHGPEPGAFVVGRVAQVGEAATTWSHHLDPASLVGLAIQLYGRAPAAYTVGVGVASLDVGDRLSPAVEAALSGIVEAVVGILERPADPVPTGDGMEPRCHA